MSDFSSYLPQGSSYYGGSGPYAGGDASPFTASPAGDINQAGASADPFAYTSGSLLTPWSGRFSSQGYGGGYSVPAFTPYSYGDFSYNAPQPGRFTENYNDPAAFRFADFAGPSGFKAPTAEDMRADPGYQARMDAVSKATTAAAAHGGALRTGGFVKGLAQAIGNQASQEYGNVYSRRAGEYDRSFAQAKDVYGINQGNTKQAFDTNTGNRLAAYNTRQNAWQGNANVALQEGTLGNNIAQGTWDRNQAKARQGYEDRRQYDQSVAGAASSNANQQYQRDLEDYTRSRDEFWTNQDRQYGILNNEASRGLSAANAYGSQMMNSYNTLGNNAIGAGDARAAGYVASGNAYGNFAGGMGGTIGGLALYGSQPQYNSPRMPAPSPYGQN